MLHNVCALGVGDMVLLEKDCILVGGGDGTLSHFQKEDSYSSKSTIKVSSSVSSLSNTARGDILVGTVDGSLIR